MTRSYNPGAALLRRRFGLFPVRSPLLGESFIYFLFLEVLRCFSSLRSPHWLTVITALWQLGCPIRKSPDQRLFAPTRSLSQLITSFIASMSQGIRHAPLSTFFRHNRAFYRQWAWSSRRKWPVGHSYFQLYCFDYQVLRLVFYFTVSLVSICQRSLGNFELWALNFELFN